MKAKENDETYRLLTGALPVTRSQSQMLDDAIDGPIDSLNKRI